MIRNNRTAAFLIIFASVAKRRVESVSDAALCAGETVAIIDVNELPPNESYTLPSPFALQSQHAYA